MPPFFSPPVWLVQLLAFAAVALAQFAFWSATGWRAGSQAPLAVILAGLFLALAAGWLCGQLVGVWRRLSLLQSRLDQSAVQLDTVRSFLGGSLRMDTELFDAADETQVMEVTLSVISDLSGARGASFIPMDEWGQALPPHFYGRLPFGLRKAWIDQAVSPETRQACRTCRQHQALPGDVCPLSGGPFNQEVGIYCFPLKRGERLLGMVNLYAPDRPELTAEQTGYLQGLLNEAALAVETLRMRTREMSALSQVQQLRPAGMDLPVLLASLVEGLQQALEIEAVSIMVRAAAGSAQPALEVRQGSPSAFPPLATAAVLDQVYTSAAPVFSPDARLVGIPLALVDRRVVGALLLSSTAPMVLDERRRAVVDAIASQAALLVENERSILSLEYRTVIQERARLAREIHDGLAQTLAFLKLQASQMQVYLAQGNLTKLNQVLKQNYDTLAEAYLETRQAIDNLRLTPQQGLLAWLNQMLQDFEEATGLKVERQLATFKRELAPEIQAQLVRILQEGLSNVRKHAHARVVRVTLHEWNGDLVVELRDDGRGFLPEAVSGLSQYGLRGMRERAELIGADFQVISRPGEGTTLRLSVPMQSQETTS